MLKKSIHFFKLSTISFNIINFIMTKFNYKIGRNIKLQLFKEKYTTNPMVKLCPF